MKKFLAITLVILITLTAVSAFATNNLPYFLTSKDCVGWEVKETANLQPMRVCIGDVVVNNIIKYDEGGIGEDTIVINLSNKPVKVFAQYGAQEQAIVDANFNLKDLKAQLAIQEFSRTEEPKTGPRRYAFDTLRFVVIDKDGKMLEDDFVTRTQFFNLNIFK